MKKASPLRLTSCSGEDVTGDFTEYPEEEFLYFPLRKWFVVCFANICNIHFLRLSRHVSSGLFLSKIPYLAIYNYMTFLPCSL